MNHLKAIGIKFIVIATILFSILSIFDTASLTEILMISFIVTGAAYLIGDLFILPKYGNFRACLADFGLAFLSVLLLTFLFMEGDYPRVLISGFAAFFIAISEGLFHIYMKEKVLSDREDESKAIGNHAYLAEFSEEENPKRKDE